MKRRINAILALALPSPTASPFVVHTGGPSYLYYRHALAVRIMHWMITGRYRIDLEVRNEKTR